MGITIREIVEDIGGGVLEGRPAASRPCWSAGRRAAASRRSLADTPIDYEALASTGAIMGSGGLVVLDDRDCAVEIARYFLHFTQNESCGKCTFCRVGTKRMLEILERICDGRGMDGDLADARRTQLARQDRQPVRARADGAEPGADDAAVLPRRVRGAHPRAALPGRGRARR